MEARACRVLMVLALILIIATELVGQTPQQWLSLFNNPGTQRMALGSGALTAVFLAICLAGFYGMYTFKAWGRSISLFTTVAIYGIWVGLMAFWPQGTEGSALTPSIAIQSFLNQLSALAWGGALALAYFSPLSTRYGANNSFNPMPLRGTG